MKPSIRQQELLAKLREHKTLTVDQFSSIFSVSKETVRRDLAILADRNLLRKIHGGATSMPIAFELHFPERIHVQHEEKMVACRKAIRLVSSGESLFIDGGTTTLLFSELLKDISDLTILTNSIHIVNQLSSIHKVCLLGGWVDIDASAVAGYSAIYQAEQFFTDHAFLSIGGLTLKHGIFNFTEMDAALSRAMIKNAAKTTVITDHTKFWRHGLVRVCGLNEIDYLATDGEVPEEFQKVLAEEGVELL
jgi:DeoR family glycerol-3-phosphate regulon repressor